MKDFATGQKKTKEKKKSPERRATPRTGREAWPAWPEGEAQRQRSWIQVDEFGAQGKLGRVCAGEFGDMGAKTPLFLPPERLVNPTSSSVCHVYLWASIPQNSNVRGLSWAMQQRRDDGSREGCWRGNSDPTA